MLKALKYVSQVHKKSTSTGAPVAEPSLFISEKPKGKSEIHVEEFKDFSDSLPIFDESYEEQIESLMTCENKCDLPSLEPEFVTDIEHAIVELTILQREQPSSLVLSPQVFEEEPLDLPHQGPRLDTRISFNEDLDPIFDEEDKPGPVFDEEATNITSIAMESHLFFDPGTTPPAPLSFELQEHCEQSDLFNSQPDMFVKISPLDAICFGLEKSDLLSSETDKIWHFLRSILDNCVVLSLDDIVDMHILKMNTIVAYLDKILERQVQPLRNESIDRAQQPEIWRNFVIQTGYLGDASDRGSVQNGYLKIQKVFCHESNFPGKPTHQGFTEAWNHFKIFMEKGVMNFPNRWFSSPSIREYQTSKGDSDPRKKRPEPKPILHEPKVFPHSTSCPNQKHCKDHGLIDSAHHENVLKPRISKRNHIFTWKKHKPKLLRPKNHFDLVHDEKFSKLALSHSFPNCFTDFHDFEISKPVFGDQFTCLVFTHVLDNYHKSLDPAFDVLRIEKPFEYFFRRFDVVPLVVLKVQDIKGQFHKEASRGGRHNTYVPGTWNWNSAEVHLPSRTAQDDRAVYRLDPLTSGIKLQPSPRPEDQSDRTSTRPSQPSRQAKVNSRARLDLDHARFDLDHFSKARIIQLSEDLGRISTLLDQATDCPDRPAFVQLLTAVTST
ncbi:hypothetical protein F2Q68_00015594 [Brassica cretica]|uniref:DUF4218 domain-containing protein n=2 Tax=Brassica cretica TaxID=69181 RepID=A0ABQ7F0T7_BRACR|nr:hypothetical protein F2Q68_00015594 [Brassica cretica]KAF3609598.1 hypothetical protein DY000_02048198 [Brassica cretica]